MSDIIITANIIKQIETIKDIVSLSQIAHFANQQIEAVSTDGTGWTIGQKIKLSTRFSGRRLFGIEGVILKVNKKKLKVDFGDGRIYNCPKTMMVAV